MRKLLAPVAALALILSGFASVAMGHTGSVVASEDCQGFIVHVFLNNNVTIDKTVDVTTTIPGTTGISGGHWNTTGNPGAIEILTLSGPAPATGTVTLTISNKGTDEFTASASIQPAKDCAPPPVPGIQIRKSNDAATTVEPGTKVTYTYEVVNTGNTPLSNVVVKDQLSGSDNLACNVDSSLYTGDTNGNHILDVGETWTFSCSTNLQVTTGNHACASADFIGGNQPVLVEACADNQVEVSHSPEGQVKGATGTPAGSLPNASIGSSGPSPLPTILFSLVLLTSLGTLAYTNVKVVARRRKR